MTDKQRTGSTRARKSASAKRPAAAARWQGEVILDVIFERGMLFLAVENLSDAPARRVSVTFDRRLPGVGGRTDVSALRLFRNIEFLAPRKAIRTFLDMSESWFERSAPTRFAARVSYVDASGRRRDATIVHDLEIYRDIGYIERSSESSPEVPQTPARST